MNVLETRNELQYPGILVDQWLSKLNWPQTPSVTFLLPWTPYSSFDAQGKVRSTEWTFENVSVDLQQCLHGPHFVNHFSSRIEELKCYAMFQPQF
ncbi:hypothetical protein T07_14073 [Trichinella nelsoni]|uniref:Uncharacterized protein n=1 Tax=Trichinella nelsoni TaxID=6336 RepID=A0A0V0RQT8_9BILA|nr:hypothetical protein T07_14073 [Trichinella nelsoni]